MRFSAAEYLARLARLRLAMGEYGVEAMILDDCEILAYFTGYETTLNAYRACVVPRDGAPFMVLRALDAQPFVDQSWFADYLAFEDGEDEIQFLARALAARGLARAAIGFDSGSHALTVDAFERLSQSLPSARLVPMPGTPWELRLSKSAAELERLRRAASIVDSVLREVIEKVEAGATPRTLAAGAAARLRELGANPAILGYITAARGWDFLHAQSQERPFQTGDVVHIELVSRYLGYEARLMRCVAIGAVDEGRRRAAQVLIGLQDAQLAAMRPGAVAADVDRVLRQGVTDAGLRDRYPNVTGYTLGYYSRVPIRSSDFTRCFTPRAHWRLEAGMVFHMYASAQGVSISETVLVRQDGTERLTKTPRRLFG